MNKTIKHQDVMLSDFVKEMDTAYSISLWFNNIPEIREELEKVCIATNAVHTITDGIYKQEILVTFTVPKADEMDLANLLTLLQIDSLLWDNLHLFLQPVR